MNATFVTLITAALSIAALPGAASDAPSGVSFKASVTTVTTDERGRVTEEPTVLVDTITNGRIARTEILRGNKDWKRGMFVLTSDGGRTLTVVNPLDRAYHDLSPATLDLEAAGAEGKLHLSVRDIDVRVEDLGAGEPVAGLPTYRYRMTRAFTATIKVLFLTKTIAISETFDFWYSRDFADTPNPVAALMVSLASVLPGIDPVFRAAHQDAARRLPGLNPVRWVHTQRTTEGRNRPSTSVSTISIDALAPVDAPPSAFEIPRGFTRARP